MTEEFEPKIVMFACNWCSYAGLDLTGTSRLNYSTNVRVIRTMCSGRIEPSFVFDAFKNGADGVIISTCHPGDCHYISGNYKTFNRFVLIQDLLEKFGIDKRRVRLEGISAAEAKKAQTVINEMVETVRSLGPIQILEEVTHV
ncbi:MAG: hydrogenase iron-sulfur subunit [Candidatus Heimdallarchaeota archaeon]|nr:hydrogenase iron-sulfur subunit [Candidatus Heimdallarchaeota archaeon]